MKKVIRLFNVLFNRTDIDEKEQDSQDLCVNNVGENDGETIIKNESCLKRKQDSIKEIFLICMEPLI